MGKVEGTEQNTCHSILQIQRESLRHMPEEEGWQESMEAVHNILSESDLKQMMPDMGYVDPGMALEEYETNGQGGLDALLTALDGSSEVTSSWAGCFVARRRKLAQPCLNLIS